MKKLILLTTVLFTMNFLFAQNSKIGLHLGHNINISKEDIAPFDNKDSNFLLGFSYTKYFKNNLVFNSNLDLIFKSKNYSKNIKGYHIIPENCRLAFPYTNAHTAVLIPALKISIPVKFGYKFNYANYNILPKLGFYGSSPFRKGFYDFGNLFELEINRTFKNMEFYFLTTYQNSLIKRNFLVNGGTVISKFNQFNLLIGTKYTFIKK